MDEESFPIDELINSTIFDNDDVYGNDDVVSQTSSGASGGGGGGGNRGSGGTASTRKRKTRKSGARTGKHTPFYCAKCDLSFTTKFGLENHITVSTTHDPENAKKWPMCQYCHKRITPLNFNNHVKNVHPMEYARDHLGTPTSSSSSPRSSSGGRVTRSSTGSIPPVRREREQHLTRKLIPNVHDHDDRPSKRQRRRRGGERTDESLFTHSRNIISPFQNGSNIDVSDSRPSSAIVRLHIHRESGNSSLFLLEINQQAEYMAQVSAFTAELCRQAGIPEQEEDRHNFQLFFMDSDGDWITITNDTSLGLATEYLDWTNVGRSKFDNVWHLKMVEKNLSSRLIGMIYEEES